MTSCTATVTQTGTGTATATATSTASATGTRPPGRPQLQPEESSSSELAPGAVLVFTLAYGNVGNGAATGVTLSDTVPPLTVFNAGASTAGWSCADASPPGTVCTHPLADLPPGGQGSLLFAVTAGAKVLRRLLAAVDRA